MDRILALICLPGSVVRLRARRLGALGWEMRRNSSGSPRHTKSASPIVHLPGRWTTIVNRSHHGHTLRKRNFHGPESFGCPLGRSARCVLLPQVATALLRFFAQRFSQPLSGRGPPPYITKRSRISPIVETAKRNTQTRRRRP